MSFLKSTAEKIERTKAKLHQARVTRLAKKADRAEAEAARRKAIENQVQRLEKARNTNKPVIVSVSSKPPPVYRKAPKTRVVYRKAPKTRVVYRKAPKRKAPKTRVVYRKAPKRKKEQNMNFGFTGGGLR